MLNTASVQDPSMESTSRGEGRVKTLNYHKRHPSEGRVQVQTKRDNARILNLFLIYVEH